MRWSDMTDCDCTSSCATCDASPLPLHVIICDICRWHLHQHIYTNTTATDCKQEMTGPHITFDSSCSGRSSSRCCGIGLRGLGSNRFGWRCFDWRCCRQWFGWWWEWDRRLGRQGCRQCCFDFLMTCNYPPT